MGEAKARRKRDEAFRTMLSANEVIVMETALAVHRKFLVPNEATGMCYRMAFFLAEYLLDRHGIAATPKVGYVNDGEGDIMTSHAWLVFNGKKTDISLTQTQHPSVPTGSLLVLDHPFAVGKATYTYHDDRTPEALLAAMQVYADPQIGPMVQHKEMEHIEMQARAGSQAMRRAYLDMAPDGFTYDRLAAIIEAQ